MKAPFPNYGVKLFALDLLSIKTERLKRGKIRLFQACCPRKAGVCQGFEARTVTKIAFQNRFVLTDSKS